MSSMPTNSMTQLWPKRRCTPITEAMRNPYRSRSEIQFLRRLNKTSPYYDPTPYSVTAKKGSMVTATQNGYRLTRNVSQFKKIPDKSTAEPRGKKGPVREAAKFAPPIAVFWPSGSASRGQDIPPRVEVTATNLPVPEVIHDSETLSNAMVGPEPEPPDNSTAETSSVQPDSPGSVSNAQNLNPGERAQPRYSYMRPRLGELEEQNFSLPRDIRLSAKPTDTRTSVRLNKP